MSLQKNEEALIYRLSSRYSVSSDAVRTILQALRSGGGREPAPEICTG